MMCCCPARKRQCARCPKRDARASATPAPRARAQHRPTQTCPRLCSRSTQTRPSLQAASALKYGRERVPTAAREIVVEQERDD